MYAESAQENAEQHKQDASLRLRWLVVARKLRWRISRRIRSCSRLRRRGYPCTYVRRRGWRRRAPRCIRRSLRPDARDFHTWCMKCRKSGTERNASPWCRRSHLPRDRVACHVRGGNRDFRLVSRRLRTTEDCASPIFREAVRVVRRAAARAILAFALCIANLGSAIRTDWIQFRCLSW
jgi:hypothetical protein